MKKLNENALLEADAMGAVEISDLLTGHQAECGLYDLYPDGSININGKKIRLYQPTDEFQKLIKEGYHIFIDPTSEGKFTLMKPFEIALPPTPDGKERPLVLNTISTTLTFWEGDAGTNSIVRDKSNDKWYRVTTETINEVLSPVISDPFSALIHSYYSSKGWKELVSTIYDLIKEPDAMTSREFLKVKNFKIKKGDDEFIEWDRHIFEEYLCNAREIKEKFGTKYYLAEDLFNAQLAMLIRSVLPKLKPSNGQCEVYLDDFFEGGSRTTLSSS